MEIKNYNSVWYEAIMKRGYGAKLCDMYETKEDAEKGIEKSNKRAVLKGYEPTEYYIIRCERVAMLDIHGDIISETMLKTRA